MSEQIDGRPTVPDIAAVTRRWCCAYHDGTMTGDAAKLAGAYPTSARASVGTWEGNLDWVHGRVAGTSPSAMEAVADGSWPLRLPDRRHVFAGDTAHVRLCGHHAGVCYNDDLSLVKDDEAWRIVHKTYYARSA